MSINEPTRSRRVIGWGLIIWCGTVGAGIAGAWVALVLHVAGVL